MNWFKRAKVELIKRQLYNWGLSQNIQEPNLSNIINQIQQEEQELLNSGFFNTEQDKRYSNSIWARQRFKELLNPQSNPQSANQSKSPEDKYINKAKGINQKYWQWVLAQMRKGIHDFDQSVFDYFKANNIENPDMSYEEAKLASDNWHVSRYENNEQSEYELGPEDGEAVLDMYMVPVGKKDEKAEGTNMNNCIGEECRVGNGTEIFSLRDKNNKPKVSVQVTNGKIVQIKAKNNANLNINEDNSKKNQKSTEYIPYIVEWIKNNRYEVESLDSMDINSDQLEEISHMMRPNAVLEAWARIGNKESLIKTIQEGANDFNTAMFSAAEFGHLDIVKYLVSSGANDLNTAMFSAAESGHLDIAKYLVSLGANDLNTAMSRAAESGHLDIVKYLVSLSGNDLNTEMYLSASTIFDTAMSLAAESGHLDIVKYLEEVRRSFKREREKENELV